ncbi:MAG TPA: HAD hydrolase family protein [Candidatus Dormibacteraeota bacterium]|nr:HAD hydrolase family protein [Candidatus Dormibacteraeota bacterium]
MRPGGARSCPARFTTGPPPLPADARQNHLCEGKATPAEAKRAIGASQETSRLLHRETGRWARTRPALLLTNLLNDLETLAGWLPERAAEGDLLNAYLLAAGMLQIVDDHLHRDPLFLRRAARRAGRRLPGIWGRAGAVALGATAGAAWWGLSHHPGLGVETRWRTDLALFVDRLAEALVEEEAWEARCPRPDLEAAARALTSRLPDLPPDLRRELVRLPSCFRNFDQTPEDLRALALATADARPERRRPLLVVGIRTSGSYLAPLLAAFLRHLGYEHVEALTMRPGQPWLRAEVASLRRAAAEAVVLLVDDPPRSWGSVRQAADGLRRLGFAHDSIVLTLGLFPETCVPESLAGHPAILLPFSGWEIQRKLQLDAVRTTVSELLAGRAEVLDLCEIEPLGVPQGRGHARARFEVELGRSGVRHRRLIQARGVGLGYFGEHALAVSRHLRGLVYEILGLAEGVLFEACPDPGSRLAPPLDLQRASAVARYVSLRAQALPLPEDLTPRLSRRGTAPQWAAHALAGLFGRSAELGRLLLLPMLHRLLRTRSPAVIDNRTRLDAFVLEDDAVLKTEVDASVFDSADFYCFDPVADVALAAASAEDAASAEVLRLAYETTAGPVGAERWLLHQLVRVLTLEEGLSPAERSLDPRPARLFQRYYREVLIGETPPGEGPLCAIDVDGVLETMQMGFPATSPAGALALRALLRHGFRPLLATGRPLDDLRDRCAAYGLVGGTAEYGSVIYDHLGGHVRWLLDPEAEAALERLRMALGARPEVRLDPRYRGAVRAFRVDERGRRRSLPADTVAQALAAAGGEGLVRPVPGFFQTDFVAATSTKEAALAALAAELGTESRLALAVGDTVTDLGMLGMATLGLAPANADAGLRQAGTTILGRPAQAGLAEAVAHLIGHRPGTCPTCAPPPSTDSTRAFLRLLEVADLASWRRLPRLLRLALHG